MYLLDTNVLVQALYGHEPEASFLEKAIAQNKLHISVIAAAEFLAKSDKKEERIFKKIAAQFPVVMVDLEVATAAAEYRKKFLQRQRRIIIVDCLIAAQAKVNHLTLVTNNRADFPMRDIKVIFPK